jgi:hypothetical protein
VSAEIHQRWEETGGCALTPAEQQNWSRPKGGVDDVTLEKYVRRTGRVRYWIGTAYCIIPAYLARYPNSVCTIRLGILQTACDIYLGSVTEYLGTP